MTITSWQESLNSIYDSEIAVDATLQIGDDDPIAVRAMDKTEGVIVGEDQGVQTISPVAVLRMSTVTAAGLTAEDLDGGTLTIDGKAWTVNAHRYKPTPEGETKGELVLLLKDGDI
jgi:hypothetical protein